jgi:dihydropyrimidinase
VVFNPNSPHNLSAETHHMNVDYSCYEGMEMTGQVSKVFLRGKLVIDGVDYLGRKGDGTYIKRDISSNLL